MLRDGLDAFEAALDRVGRARTRPQVTLSATHAFSARWLVPRLVGFRERHPGVDVVLQASDEVVDLAGGVDLAIRYGRGPYPGLVASELFADRFAPVASPRLGVRSAEDLDRVALIHFQWRRAHPHNPTWEAWFAAAHRPWTSPPGQLHFSDEGHAILAATAGQGVALLSLALVGDELASGRLVQPLGPTLPGHTYHLVASPERPLSACAQAAAHWLREQAAMASISMSAAGS